MKTVILDPKDDQVIFFIVGENNKDVGVIMTYNSRDIFFHTSVFNCPHFVYNKMKFLFDKVDGIQVMHIKKELIFLDPHSFERIQNYLARIKELQLKLGECGKIFLKKDGQLIELVPMNLRTHYDVVCSSFHVNCHGRKIVRTISLIPFVIYWIRINKNCLIKGSFVVSTRLVGSKTRSIKITKKGSAQHLEQNTRGNWLGY